jgi:hypothetical protein
MSRKTNNTKAATPIDTDVTVSKSLPIDASTAETGADKASDLTNKTPAVTEDITDIKPIFNVVLEGKGKKLSPKTKNHVFFEVAVNEDDNELYLRLSNNEGGGLHSKEWIKVDAVFELLDQQDNRPFKSTVFKSVFKGASANNAAFLAASVRAEGLGLIGPSEKSVFLHVVVADYAEHKARLQALAPSK